MTIKNLVLSISDRYNNHDNDQSQKSLKAGGLHETYFEPFHMFHVITKQSLQHRSANFMAARALQMSLSHTLFGEVVCQ